MRLDRPGWSYAPDAYRCLGELTVPAGGLSSVSSRSSPCCGTN